MGDPIECASIRSAFESVHIDPNAGQDFASRVQARAKRAAGKLTRVLKRLGTYV